MIGDITFDKSSKNMSLFLYSIYIIGTYGTDFSIRRNFFNPCFVEHMAKFTNSKAYKIKNGNTIEERTLYNKSLYAQYYGFIERKKDKSGKELLCLTTRGKIIYNFIECDEVKRICKLKDGSLRLFQDLIWDSILFDSFGKMNDGAQDSKTDIDAPKVIFRTIFDLGHATNEEIFYILFCLNRGDSASLKIDLKYEDLLEIIKRNREKGRYDYSDFFSRNRLTNKVSDSKVIDILADPSISLIEKSQQNQITFNYLSKDCDRFLDDKYCFNCWYVPHNFIFHSRSLEKVTIWLHQTILNKSKDSDNCIWLNSRDFDEKLYRKELVKSVNLAYNLKHRTNPNKTQNVFLITICKNEDELERLLGPFTDLLLRKDDYTSDRSGESAQFVSDPLIGADNICFPSNFNFIAIITSK